MALSRFTVSGDCVTDNLTGLMWAKNGNLPNGLKTWQGVLDFVASLNNGTGLCGYHDWRVPNINELESLLNVGEGDSATWLNSQGFSNVQSPIYWSSTTTAGSTVSAWAVTMGYGFVSGDNKSDYRYYVWPVRSGQSGTLVPSEIWMTGQTTSYALGDDGDLEKGVAWPSPRFMDHGNGTITDNLTGLMWTKNANLAGGGKPWQEALDYVKSINSGAGLGGYHDWRLPNRKELFSLIDHSKWDPALPASHPFQNVQSYGYWSSTSVADTGIFSHSCAWVVFMWYGDVYVNAKGGGYDVWPVRSGQGPLGYPDISVTPNPVEFGSVNVGATSDQTATIKNDGNADLVVGAITQPSQPFSKIQDNCSGQTIAPNATCTVMYRFAPTTLGNFSSSSNIPSNDPDENPVTLTLNGIGSVYYTITTSVNPPGAGTVTLNPAGGTYTAGTMVTLTATANSGYSFSTWSGDLTGSVNPAQITMDGNKSVTAVFLLIKVEEDNPAITYTGTWNTYTSPSCSGGAMKYSGQKGAKAEFSFTGTGIKWIVTKAKMMGKAKVYLDGVYMALVDLYSSSPAYQVVLQKTGLAPGNHTLRLEVSGQKNPRATGYYINIDAFEVIP